MYNICVIVPVYNVENYLKRCVNSLLNQDFDSYEILLIDDGSTDKSSQICDSFICYKNIRVFHKENTGLSDTRNFGIKHARAQFITFVDSDDYVTSNYLSKLYSLIKKYNADIAACSTIVKKDNFDKKYKNFKPEIKVLNSKKMLKNIFLKKYGIGVSAWAKLYKKTLFEDIEFPIDKIYEDLATIPFLVSKSNRIVITNEENYYYCIRENSITTSELNLYKDMQLFENLKKVERLINNKFPDLIDVFNNRYLCDSLQLISKISQSNLTINKKIDIINQIINKDKNIWIKFYKNKFLSKRRKIYILILMISPRLYLFLYNLKNLKSNK